MHTSVTFIDTDVIQHIIKDGQTHHPYRPCDRQRLAASLTCSQCSARDQPRADPRALAVEDGNPNQGRYTASVW